MAVRVFSPRLGADRRPGVVAEWYRSDGAAVRKGEAVYRFERDFVAVDVEADADGILHLRTPAGEPTEPGNVVALILAPGETPDQVEPVDVEAPPAPGIRETPPAPAVAPPPAAEVPEPSPAAGDAPPALPLLRRRTLPEPEAAPPGSAWESIFGDRQDLDDDAVWASGHGMDLMGARPEPDPVEDAAPAPEAPADTGPSVEDDGGFFDVLRTPEPVEVRPDEPSPPAVPETWVEPEPVPVAAVVELPVATTAEPIPFPAMGVVDESWPTAGAPGLYIPPPPMYLRATVRMAEVRKMRDQLAREWRESGLSPENEDIALRALARAAREISRLADRGDDAGLVLLAADGERLAVLPHAASGPLRDQVAVLAEARHHTDATDCAWTLTSFAAFGLDEGMPVLPEGHPFALAMGAMRPVHEGEAMPVPVAIFTAAFNPDLMTVGEAALLLARVRELLEAPYALLAS